MAYCLRSCCFLTLLLALCAFSSLTLTHAQQATSSSAKLAPGLTLFLETAPFSPDEHEVIVDEYGSVKKIDGCQEFFGTDNVMPPFYLRQAYVLLDGQRHALDTSCMYTCDFCPFDAEAVAASPNPGGAGYRLEGRFSDGAGTYYATWLVTPTGTARVRIVAGPAAARLSMIDSVIDEEGAVHDTPADLLEMIGGKGIQFGVAYSRDAWVQQGLSGSALPNDSRSYIGRSMALGPGTRRDIYYIAVAGSSDTVGQVVCEASADLTLTEIDGFARTERVMLRVAWGEDTCGLDLLGVVYYQVYAWVDTSATLHMWMPSAEYPEDMPTPPDEDDDEIASAFKLCDAPTITLTGGDTTTGHPAGVCDPEVLFGPGNYRLSNTPGW